MDRAESNEGELTARGARVLGMRIKDSSRSQYNSTIRRLVAWLRVNHPGCVANSLIVLPLPSHVCVQFLSYASIKRDSAGAPLVPETPNRYPTINAIKSAIIYLYKENKMKVSHDLDEMLKGTNKVSIH